MRRIGNYTRGPSHCRRGRQGSIVVSTNLDLDSNAQLNRSPRHVSCRHEILDRNANRLVVREFFVRTSWGADATYEFRDFGDGVAGNDALCHGNHEVARVVEAVDPAVDHEIGAPANGLAVDFTCRRLVRPGGGDECPRLEPCSKYDRVFRRRGGDHNVG